MDMSFEQKILLENNQKSWLWKYGSVYFGQMQMGWKTFEQLIIWFTDLWMCKFANMDIDQLTIFYLHLFDQMSVSQMVFEQKALIGNDPKFLSALNMLIKGRLADRHDVWFAHLCLCYLVKLASKILSILCWPNVFQTNGFWPKDVTCKATKNAGFENKTLHFLVKSKLAKSHQADAMFSWQICGSAPCSTW